MSLLEPLAQCLPGSFSLRLGWREARLLISMAGRIILQSPSQPPRGNPLDRILEVLTSLRRVIRATDLHSRHLSKTTGVTAPQILILQAINSTKGVTLSEIAHSVSLSQATVSSILDRLEKRELITRERSTVDKRRVHAYLTEYGRQVLRDAPLPLQEQFTRQFSALEEWEQSMIISALQRVAMMMDADHIDASPILDVGTLDRPVEPHKTNAADTQPVK